jgi:hypothetical protein
MSVECSPSLRELKLTELDDRESTSPTMDQTQIRWNGGMKGRKGSTDEGGVRSACFIRWNNRIESGSTYEGVSGAIDLLPTLTALAGVKIHAEKPLDGIDQSAFLLGDSTAFPDRTLFTAWAGNVAARKRNFLLDATGSLYDFETDPAQKSSLNRSHAELRESMQASVRRWREEMRLDSLNKSLRNTQVDARPISVGYKEFPRIWLPARDAEATGKSSEKRTGTKLFLLRQLDFCRRSHSLECSRRDLGDLSRRDSLYMSRCGYRLNGASHLRKCHA